MWIELAQIGLASLAVWPPALTGLLIYKAQNRQSRRRVLRDEHRQLAVIADQQHQRYLHGDLRGVFGARTPVDIETGKPLDLRRVHDSMIDADELDADCEWCCENYRAWLDAEKSFYEDWLEAEENWKYQEAERKQFERCQTERWRAEQRVRDTKAWEAATRGQKYDPFAYTIPHDENDVSGLSCRCNACIEHRKWVRDKQLKDKQRRESMKVMGDIARQLEIPLPILGGSPFTESAMLALKTGSGISKHKTEAWNAYLRESSQPSTNCPECMKMYKHGDPCPIVRCTERRGGNCKPA